MNEERSSEEQQQYDETLRPGTKPIAPRERYQEFDQQRGEVQRRGSRDALGNPPPSPPSPVGIAPPDPMNVVSNFDTRPIGAFDFAHTEITSFDPGEVDEVQEVHFQVPKGYTAALRRVEFEFINGMVVNLAASLPLPPPNVMVISLMRDQGVIPHNSRNFYGDLVTLDWPTHQVFGQDEAMGVRMAPTGYAIPGAPDTVWVQVTFMGVLIPTKGRPPAVEIASDPVLIRDYDRYVKQPPDLGAAGK